MDFLTPDILNGIASPEQMGQPTPTPQQPPAPNQPPFNINDIFQQQQNSGTKITDYLQKLTEAMRPSARELELQKITANTPQKRADEMYNKMFGISHEDLYDPTNRTDPNAAPTGQKTHINWKQAIPGFLGEVARAYTQGKNYVPAQDRARETALHQYQAEINPLKSELGIEGQNKRAMMADTINALGKEVANNHWLGSNLINQQKADQQKQLIAIKQTLAPLQGKELEAKIERLHSQNDVAGAEKLLKQAQTTSINNLTGNRDLKDSEKLKETEATKLKVAEIMGGVRAKRITDNNGIGGITDVRTGDTIPIKAPGAPVQNAQTGTLPIGQTPPGIPPPPIAIPGVNAPAIGDTSKLTGTMPGVPPKTPVTWQTPQQKYGNTALYPVTAQFKDTPEGHTPANDALLNDVVTKISPAQKKTIQSSMDLYTKGQNASKVINSLPDDAFGTIHGNLNKWLSDRIDQSKLGGDAETQNKLEYLRGLAETIAVSHLGAQNIRSGEMSKRIADEINSWGTTKAAIASKLKAYTDQAGEAVRHTPGSKILVAPMLGSYRKLQEFYEPDDYNSYVKDSAQKELDRRKKK